MTKDELVEGVLRNCEVSKANVERFYDGLSRLITKELLGQGEMVLPGLGVLRVITLKARTARNPQTGGTVQVPRKRTARFRPHKELREALNPGMTAPAAAPGAPGAGAPPAAQP